MQHILPYNPPFRAGLFQSPRGSGLIGRQVYQTTQLRTKTGKHRKPAGASQFRTWKSCVSMSHHGNQLLSRTRSAVFAAKISPATLQPSTWWALWNLNKYSSFQIVKTSYRNQLKRHPSKLCNLQIISWNIKCSETNVKSYRSKIQ